MLYKDFRNDLISIDSTKNPDFTKRITNTNLECIGLYSKQIKIYIKKYEKEEFEDFNFNDLYESNLIYFSIKLKQLKTLCDQIKFILNYAKYIDTRAITDSTFQIIKKANFTEMLHHIQKLISSKFIFAQRYGYLLLFNFKKDKKLYEIAPLFKNTDEYYIQMVEARVLAEYYIFDRDGVTKYLLESDLDYNIKNIAILKICESFRVDKTDKEYLKTLRRIIKTK